METSTVARSQNSDKTTEEAKRDAEHEKNADGMEAERSEYPNRGRTEDRMSDEFTGVKSPYVGAGEEGLVAISGEEKTSMEAEKENPDVVSGGESPDVSRSMGDTNSDKSSGGVRSAVQEGRGNVTNRPKEAWADTNAQLPKRIGEEGALVLAQGHAERQKFPIMSGEASAECKANQDTGDWILVENQFALLDRNLHQLCQSQTTSDVALFLHLLVNILKDEHPVADELDETLRLVGYVLERTNAQCIDVAVVGAVQAMAEYVASSAAQASVHEHLLLNFALWSCSSCDVRISHVQYLSTLIKDRPAHFRADFGVKFFLDVVRLYYDGSAAGLHDHGRAGCVELTEGEVKSIRGSLLGEARFFVAVAWEWLSKAGLTCDQAFSPSPWGTGEEFVGNCFPDTLLSSPSRTRSKRTAWSQVESGSVSCLRNRHMWYDIGVVQFTVYLYWIKIAPYYQYWTNMNFSWISLLTLSLPRMFNLHFPLQPYQKYCIIQYGERGFS